jgi:two-component system, cell cycle sensor histidine kinase and response regulator CckA
MHMSQHPERAAITDGEAGHGAERHLADERLRLAVEGMGSMIFDFDVATRVIFRSDAIVRVFGWEESEPTEEWWSARVHPEDAERVRGIVLPILHDGRGTGWEAEYRFRRGDGSYATVLERATAIRDEHRNVLRCVGTVTDVSDRAELAAQLRQAQKMEAVGQLAGGIAHDFNNLLTAINCNVELLLDATDPDDARREDIIQIREAATRAATLTRQLLAFSRRQVLQPRPLDLNSTVASMERMLRRVLAGDVVLRTTLDSSIGAVYADAGQMEQVLMNLVLNARDAMPDGGSIVVRTSDVVLGEALQHRFGLLPPGSYVTLAVRDTGSGMTDDILEHLFEPFFTTKSQGKGTGLGLATVHGIVMQSGGQVVVESVPGRGTEFRVYLPRFRGSAPQRRETPGNGVPLTAGRARTVLVVDDDDAVRDVAARALARAGYRVLAANGPAAAMEVIHRQDDRSALLVLTDVLMPVMNGDQLAERIAEQWPSLRVSFMSGYSTDELARSGIGAPSRSFLIKPFTLPELVGFVLSAFESGDEGET